MSRPAPVYREGSNIIQIRAVAAGDGDLSFVAFNSLTGLADPTPPSEAEARSVCPPGWNLYAEGPNWRARKTEAL